MTVELLLTVPARLWNFFQYASIQRIVIQRIVIVFLGYVFSEWGPKRVLENALSTAFCTRAHGYNAVLSTKRRVEHKSRGDSLLGAIFSSGRGAWLARVEGAGCYAGCRTGTLSGGLGSNIHEWRAGLGVRLGLPIKSFLCMSQIQSPKV